VRVLILGAAGMLGHKLWQVFRDRFDTWATIRANLSSYARYGLFDSRRVLVGVDALDLDSVARALAAVRPDAVVNCIGIVKQARAAADPIVSLAVNSLFPHRLANLCQLTGAYFIHISTDCVFSGRRGMYCEEDTPDAEDLYGRTKLLGEVDGPGCVTLRTSIVGRELRTTYGLVEWFLSSRGGAVRGYTQAVFSGFTTLAMADIIANVLDRHPELSGLYNVSAEPISKYKLLCLLRDAFSVQIDVEPDSDVRVDRSLDSTRFREATGFVSPTWEDMMQGMAEDPTPYEAWRNADGS
jgi:dTDP-4-dehydrorhamnose reductase